MPPAAPRPEVVEQLRVIADDHHVRSPAKLRGLALRLGHKSTAREAEAALQERPARQVFAPPPRAQGKTFAEGAGSRFQADLMDFAQNQPYNRGREYGKGGYALQLMDVFTHRVWTKALRNKTSAKTGEAMQELAKKAHMGRDAVLTTDAGLSLTTSTQKCLSSTS
jgi:hypothetical protein